MTELIFEWTTHFDSCSEEVYAKSLSTLIGEDGARKLVDIAKIYEQYDWFRLLLARMNDQVVGELALYCSIMNLFTVLMKGGFVFTPTSEDWASATNSRMNLNETR